jgi:predicted ester cyclase
MTVEPLVALMRRYVVDYTNRHDTSVCAELMEPDYTLRMGAHEVAGRDELYIPAAEKQFTQFPGLGLTVHDVVTNGDRLAMRFTEHGASNRHGGARASWAGLGLYRWNGTKLTENWVEQDYQARRRQLASGVPDPVAPPAIAPWDTLAVAADPAAEKVAREWVSAGLPDRDVWWDDGAVAGPRGNPDELLDGATQQVDDLFSAGDRVAVRVTRTGTYAGGLDDVDPSAVGRQATLHLVALLTVADGEVVGGHGVRNRLDLARSLAKEAA